MAETGALPRVPISQLVRYFLRLGALGFGGAGRAVWRSRS
jgi:chromate transport protein ChrA